MSKKRAARRERKPDPPAKSESPAREQAPPTVEIDRVERRVGEDRTNLERRSGWFRKRTAE